MIPGVGRYSMLITPRGGSLFHAVFHLGVGLFFGGAKEAMAALFGHVVLGAILGVVARLPDRSVH